MHKLEGEGTMDMSNKGNVYVVDSAVVIPQRMAMRDIVDRDQQRWIGGMEDAAVCLGHGSYAQQLVDNELELGVELAATSHSTELSASDLAAEAVRQLLESPRWRRPSNIVFAHASIDEDIAGSGACRMQLAAQAPQAIPLSVSQLEECSGFAALWLASAYLARSTDDATVLVVSADKWTPPQSRWHPPHLPFGDSACALLLSAQRPDQNRPCVQLGDFELAQLWSGVASQYSPAHVGRIVRALRSYIERLGLDKPALISPALHGDVSQRVAAELGLSAWPCPPELQGINLATVHSLIDVALRSTATTPSVTPAVSWNVTPGGHFAAMLVTQLP